MSIEIVNRHNFDTKIVGEFLNKLVEDMDKNKTLSEDSILNLIRVLHEANNLIIASSETVRLIKTNLSKFTSIVNNVKIGV